MKKVLAVLSRGLSRSAKHDSDDGLINNDGDL